jgi:hypothetical protein
MNARGIEYKVIFCPLRYYDRSTLDLEPFIEIRLDRTTSESKTTAKGEVKETAGMEKWNLFDVNIGHMELRFHKETIMGLL